MKSWTKSICLVVICCALSACFTDVLTGANVIYDRHHWYQKLGDYQLLMNVKEALYREQGIKCPTCTIEITVFNRDVLLVGQLPSHSLQHLMSEKLQHIQGMRHLYNEISVSHVKADVFMDTWITAKIRSEILADSTIDPNQFKVITYNRVVYLMGNVMPEDANKVVMFAREWSEVRRVVKLFQYYQLTDHGPSNQIKPVAMESSSSNNIALHDESTPLVPLD